MIQTHDPRRHPCTDDATRRARQNTGRAKTHSLGHADDAAMRERITKRPPPKPTCIVSDNGTEFTSKAIRKWANDNGVE